MKTTKKKKLDLYAQSAQRFNRLIKKHPRSALLFDFLKGKLIAKSIDPEKIRKKHSALSKNGSSLIMHEPTKKGISQIFTMLTAPGGTNRRFFIQVAKAVRSIGLVVAQKRN